MIILITLNCVGAPLAPCEYNIAGNFISGT
jgi:hypothetical protein